MFFCTGKVRGNPGFGLLSAPWRTLAFGIAVYLTSLAGASAQGSLNPVVLQTGGGQPLISAQENLQLNGPVSPMLYFDFGFFTEEDVVPEEFLDAFTVTIQDASLTTAVLLTVDAGGTIWAPFTPGAVLLNAGDVARSPLIPPSMTPILERGIAFSVQLPVPTQFTGPSITIFFDLFDNQNAQSSLAWYRNPRLDNVPEPGSAALFLSGLLLIAIRRKRRHELVRP